MFLGFSDYAREGSITSSQAFAGSAPLSLLKTRPLGKRARSTAPSGSVFRLSVDLGVPRFLGLVGMLRPDPLLMPDDAPFPVPIPTARVELSNVSAAGAEVWSGYTTGTRHALAVPSAGITRALPFARYVSFVFRSDVANWSCGRIWCSPVFWPQDGVDFNWSVGVVGSGGNRVLRGGANNPRPGVILDTLSTNFGSLALAEAIGPAPTEGTSALRPMLRVVGNTGEVLAVPRGLGRVSPTGWIDVNAAQLDELALYGRITSDLAAAVQHTDGDNYSASLSYVEER